MLHSRDDNRKTEMLHSRDDNRKTEMLHSRDDNRKTEMLHTISLLLLFDVNFALFFASVINFV
jgi:hypothetical protein